METHWISIALTSVALSCSGADDDNGIAETQPGPTSPSMQGDAAAGVSGSGGEGGSQAGTGGSGNGASAGSGGGSAGAGGVPRLRVAPDNRHYLETEDSRDFLWLGNMPWLPEQISKTEMGEYLDARQAQGHTAISIVAHNWESPLYNDEVPFTDHGPVVLNEAYWSFIDWIVDEAAERKIYVALAALWGYEADLMFDDPYQHNYDYGRLLGERYGDRTNIVFVAAGEFQTIKCANRDYCSNQDAITDEERTLFKRIVDGFREGAASGDPDGKILVTLHGTAKSPSHWTGGEFHDKPWVDFYLEQTWQEVNAIDEIFPYDWDLENPIKPSVQGETGWWERSSDGNLEQVAWAQRYQGYWSLFHGATGHTYSSFFWENIPGDFDLDGAQQMAYLKGLILSKPAKSRVPDQTLLTADTVGSDEIGSRDDWDPTRPNLRCATRADDGTWAFIYSTKGEEIGVRMERLADGSADAYWYDPRNGKWHDGEQEASSKTPFMSNLATGNGVSDEYFDPPGDPGVGADWVLVLEVN